MTGGTFLLVHGAWHGAWCWDRVASRLRANGHRVHVPTLTGLAERAHLLSDDITLSTHIADIVELIDRDGLEDIVLCGHSYGGMVISGVAEQRRQAIRSMVYLDAFLPKSGDSIASMTPIGQALADLLARGMTTIPPFSAEQFAVNADDRAWVDARCTQQPLGTFEEALVLTGARDLIPSKVYVRAADYPAPWFDAALAATQEDPAWTTHVIKCGHDAMIDCPDAVTRILERS